MTTRRQDFAAWSLFIPNDVIVVRTARDLLGRQPVKDLLPGFVETEGLEPAGLVEGKFVTSPIGQTPLGPVVSRRISGR
jgi:hypothetical protein